MKKCNSLHTSESYHKNNIKRNSKQMLSDKDIYMPIQSELKYNSYPFPNNSSASPSSLLENLERLDAHCRPDQQLGVRCTLSYRLCALVH